MSEPSRQWGARTPSGWLPLQSVDLDIEVRSVLYKACFKQKFVNSSSTALEVTYIFPMPVRAGLSGYCMHIGDRVITGEMRKRANALEEYEVAQAEGKTVSKLEQERPDLLNLVVGNLDRNQTLTIELHLDGPLSFEGLEASFRFPLVATSRYISGAALPGPQSGRGEAKDSDTVPDASRLNPPQLKSGQGPPPHLKLRADIQTDGLPIAQISCTSHSAEIETVSKKQTLVRLEGPYLDRDFVLRFPLRQKRLQSHLWTRTDPTGTTFLLSVLAPPDPGPSEGRDVIVVLDRSGSMDGWNLVAARHAAAQCINALLPEDRFAVIVFDDRVELYAPHFLPASDSNKFRAVSHLRQVEIRGGTELFGAFLGVSRYLEESEDRETCLVLLTDGCVADQDRLTAWARHHQEVRIHSLGIGEAAQEGLLQRLSANSGGTCQVVENGFPDRLNQATRALVRAFSGPVLRDLRLEGARVKRVSPEVWDAYAGQPTLLHGRFQVCPEDHLELVGVLPDGSEYRTPLTPQATDQPALTRVWARSYLLDLEDQWAADPISLHELEDFRRAQIPVPVTTRKGSSRSGWIDRTRDYWRRKGWILAGLLSKVPALPLVVSVEGTSKMASLPEPQWLGGESPEQVKRELTERALALQQLEEEIEELSLCHGILSRFTAFLSVDHEGAPVSGPVGQMTQPVSSVARGRKPDSVVQLMQIDPLVIELGEDLLYLVDSTGSNKVVHGVEALRKAVCDELGFFFPSVRFRDHLSQHEPSTSGQNFRLVGQSLQPCRSGSNEYRIQVKGEIVAQDSLSPGELLVIGPEESLKALKGNRVEEPVYGLPALWIAPDLAERAFELGCGVFEPGAVLLSHLGEVIREHAWALFGQQDAQQILEAAVERQPELRELDFMLVFRVFQTLLRRGLNLRDAMKYLDVMIQRVRSRPDAMQLADELFAEFAPHQNSMEVKGSPAT